MPPPVTSSARAARGSAWPAGLLAVLWAAEVVLVLGGGPAWLRQAGAVGVLLYIPGALLAARRETRLVVGLLGAATAGLVAAGGSPAAVLDGLGRSLLFLAILPTLQLCRAVAGRMQAVRTSQARLAALPAQAAEAGLVVGGHAFGSVLSTGAIAVVSALVPEAADERRRLAAAQAAMRGINTAVYWSPFYVGFAVAAHYLPEVPLWQIMPLGLAMAALALAVGFLLFGRPIEPRRIAAALACLGPILPLLAVAGGSVIAASATTGLGTLGAILVVMPVLCGLWLAGRPAQTAGVAGDLAAALVRMADDVLLAIAAVVLGTVAAATPAIQEMLAPLVLDWLPPHGAAAAVILVTTLGGLAGLHPLITATVLLATLAGLPATTARLALMEAALIGWGLAAMVSVSSLSLVLAASLFRLRPLAVAGGRNLAFAAVYGTLAGAVLTAVSWLLSAS